ncbi:MAG: CBS domain-containing protein [Candidatus Competibacteraceae bacterium]|nr:CBS domain-containing protein [Candidatus Competibacteraceae bacterium]
MPRINRYTPLAELAVVVLDTETTGLDVSRDRIVQIGAVRVARGHVQPNETFLTLVNPGIPIPPASTAIHGIGDAAVQSAPSFETIKPNLDAFLGDAVIVGQSVGFDLAILLRETRRIGDRWHPPHFLDTKLLDAALNGDSRERSLDELMAALGVSIGHRHTALDDARATAEIFVRLLPLLASKGIRTLAEAEAHANAQFRILERQAREGWYDATSVRPEEAWIDGRDREALASLDPFLYRHRLRHVMRTPALLLSPHTTVLEAARRMDAEQRGVIIVGDAKAEQVWGIVTERDLLRALVREGGGAADRRIEDIMTETVVSLPEDAFLYRALARMWRAGIRHLAVTDPTKRIVGTLSANTLLGERASQAMLLGAEVSEATHAADLARARARLPTVARELLANAVDAVEIARVLSFELRELIGRAAILAERMMENAGAGRPPVPYALLVLGSGGRGESLLAAEQDNALIYESDDPAGTIDGWFARFGEHLARIIHESGVHYCADGVMVRNPAWRGSLDTWRDRLRNWSRYPDRAGTEHADLVFDGHLAYGDTELDAEFRIVLGEETNGNRALAQALARPALALEIPPDAETRVDLKRYGLLPVTAAARALAVRHGIAARSTPERLAAACSAGVVTPAVRDRLDEVQSRLQGWLLRQQIDDLEAGRLPTKVIDIEGMPMIERQALQCCFERVRELPAIVRAGLS